MIRLIVLVSLFVIFHCCLCTEKKKINNRPIIGILTQQIRAKFTPKISNSQVYIAASYVKYLEMAGAQVVPILSTWSKTKIRRVMGFINGLLFPGGAAPIKDSPYYTKAKVIFDEAKKFNNKGVHFPLWGTCLGFETLHALAAGKDTTVKTDAENISLELNLTQHAFSSRLFEEMDKPLMQSLMFEKISMNMHNRGIPPKIYTSNMKLNAMFRVLSTNFDLKGTEFVSTVEGVKYPFYGTQWHPEKNIYEWTRNEAINHSPSAVRVAQYLANFFVNEARKNFQGFPDDTEEEKYAILRYSPVFSGGTSNFEQVYVFGNHTESVLH